MAAYHSSAQRTAQSFRVALRGPLAFAAAATLLSAAGFANGTAMAQLEYRRDAILSGEWWRLLTGHLVHLSWTHLALNLLGIAIVGAVSVREHSRAFATHRLLALTLGTSLLLLAAAPQLQWYRGASGVLHGLLLLVLLDVATTTPRAPWAWAGVVVLVAKTAIEQRYGSSTPSLFAASGLSLGGPVATAAHAAGTVAAAVTFVGERACAGWRARHARG